MRKITKLFILLLLTTAGFPTNSQAETYPATAPYGYELVEDASTLQAGDVIIIRQASGNNYLKINNTRTTNASMATNFVLEDAGTGNSSDFYLKAEGTENYLKAAAASGTMASTTNVSEKGVFNIKIASASGSSPETTIGFANFKGGDQDHVIRLITTSTSDNTSRIWYNSNGWAYGTGGGHWTGFYAFKKQDNVSGQVATLSYNDIEIYKDGNKVTPGSNNSFNHQVRSTSSPLITVTIGSGDVVYNTSMFTFGNGNKTYTIAIEDGYFITGFTINYTTGSGVTFSSNGVTSSDNGQLAVTGLLNTTSTTFNVSGTSNAWRSYYVMSIEVTYEAIPQSFYDAIFQSSTVGNPKWYAMSIANTSSWWQATSNTAINNSDGSSLPTGIADAYAWAFYGDAVNGYKIQNKSTGRYLGGRTSTGGNLTLVDEADAVLFVPEYNSATNIKWKSKDYGYYVDRSSGSPYAHTSGQVINFQNLYNVNFTCSGGQLSTVYVGGTEVSLNTPVVLASGAIITSGALVNAIETYNGFNTLAEALADAGFNGTVDVALSAVLSNITINVMRGSTVVKTVTIENVPENAVITVADAVGTPNYVSNITPATITGTSADQSVDVTYTSSLPLTLSDDPTSAGATAYLLTLNSQYCYGNALSSSCDFGNSYYWTFGGDEYNGITVYNKNNGYLRIATSNNTPATFDSSTPFAFAISPNTVQTDAFSLYVPGSSSNTYVNKRTSTIATWVTSASNAISDAGCCLKIYTENDAVAGFLSDLQPYFTYAGCVNALTASAAAELNSTYESFTQNPPRASEYLALKATIEANVVQPTEGYYIVYNALEEFENRQGVKKAMYYNTNNSTIEWNSADGSAAQVMKLKAVSGASTYRLYAPLADVYLQTKKGATTSTETDGLAFEVLASGPASVNLAYDSSGGQDAALHANGHSGGSGVSGTLTNWTLDSEASMWRLYPLDIPEITLIAPNGVAAGDEVYQSFAYGSNKQLPLNVGVHYISTNSGNFAHIETVNSSAIRANEGYIIRGVKGATVPLLPIGEVDALSSTNLLVGVVEPTKVYSGYMLAYKGNDAEQKFYKIKDTGLSIPAYRSYLTAAAAANVRGLELLFGGIGDDEITGIDGINTGGTEGAIFDLQGRRVTKPEKGGIYIINGKKVMK